MWSISDINLFGLVVILGCAAGAVISVFVWPPQRRAKGTFMADAEGMRELSPAEIKDLERRMAEDKLQRSLNRLNAPRPMSDEAWARILKDRQTEPRP